MQSTIINGLVDIYPGISLEVDLSRPSLDVSETQNVGNKLAICLHPWSWLGGRMNDPVLMLLCEPLYASKYHVLRYNSRGVGMSTGRPSFSGFEEGKDLEAVTQWALGRVPNVQSIVIIGYSYGSLIASLLPVLPSSIKTAHLLLSYPLSPRGLLTMFNGSTYSKKLHDLLLDENSKVLIVFGDEDEFTGAAKYRTWTQELRKLTINGDRLTVIEIANASHFWQGQAGRDLRDVIRTWLP